MADKKKESRTSILEDEEQPAQLKARAEVKDEETGQHLSSSSGTPDAAAAAAAAAPNSDALLTMEKGVDIPEQQHHPSETKSTTISTTNSSTPPFFLNCNDESPAPIPQPLLTPSRPHSFPGAFSVIPLHLRGSSDEDESDDESTNSGISADDNHTVPATFSNDDIGAVMGREGSSSGSSHLIQAHLVTNNSDDDDAKLLVEAEPALEGFAALIHNTRFRVIVVVFFISLLTIIIPVSVVIPKQRNNISDNSNSSVFECGTVARNQADYRGNVSVTEAGDICQAWASQYPKSHKYNPDLYPTAGLDENYCRNPNSDARAWCFSVNTSTRAYCSVPYCDKAVLEERLDCGTPSLNYEDYRGTINVTKSGIPCQPWDQHEPHSHPNVNTPELSPLAGLENNYCRVPDSRSKPWCYTTDPEVKFESCDVPSCEELVWEENEAQLLEDMYGELCYNCTNQECGTPQLFQMDYRGAVNVTETGRTCQRWDAEEPWVHSDTMPEVKPASDLRDNYCRMAKSSKNKQPRAWCFTTDPEVRWEHCSIPACMKPVHDTCGTRELKQSDYRGTVSTTVSGRTCQRWDEEVPHKPDTASRPDRNLFAGLDENFCRNPNPYVFERQQRAWCYTTDPQVEWEYCSIPFCDDPDNSIFEDAFYQDCGTDINRQSDYRGFLNTTFTGRTCQRWESLEPHDHKHTPENRPNSGLDENYCRNPDNSQMAWCYTTDPDTLWEYCDVPRCQDL